MRFCKTKMAPKSDDAVTNAEKEKTEPPKKKTKEELKKEKEALEELSDDDKQLKDDLELCVQRLTEDDASLYGSDLTTMGNLIKASTTSMTSVPKPLKFMNPHFETMKKVRLSLILLHLYKTICRILSRYPFFLSGVRENGWW